MRIRTIRLQAVARRRIRSLPFEWSNLMPNDGLFRIAGWCALASAVLLVAAAVSFPLGAGAVGGALESIFLLTLAVVFFALYVAHRSESRWLSLAGLILVFPAIGMDVASMTNYGNTVLSSLWYLLLSLPFLIFGILGFRSAKMPRGLAVVALLIGVTYFISGTAGLLGSQDLSDNISLIPMVLMLVWLGWLCRVFLSGRLTSERLPVAPSGAAHA
jgi:hypothetical protein